jgi:hypothetical protein
METSSFLVGTADATLPPDAVYNWGCVLSFTVYHFVGTQNTYSGDLGVLK